MAFPVQVLDPIYGFQEWKLTSDVPHIEAWPMCQTQSFLRHFKGCMWCVATELLGGKIPKLRDNEEVFFSPGYCSSSTNQQFPQEFIPRGFVSVTTSCSPQVSQIVGRAFELSQYIMHKLCMFYVNMSIIQLTHIHYIFISSN